MKTNLLLTMALATTTVVSASDTTGIATNEFGWFPATELVLCDSVTFPSVEITSDGEVSLSKPPKEAAKDFWDAVSTIGKWDAAFRTNKAAILEVIQFLAQMQKADEAVMVNAVYVGQSNELRAEADKMDRRDRIIEKARKLLETLKESNQQGKQ